MKLLSFIDQGRTRIGKLEGRTIHAIENFTTILELIEHSGLERLEFSPQTLELEAVTLLAPIPQPRRNLICLGKNYKDHALELKHKIKTNLGVPDEPIYFTKLAHRTVGSQGSVESYFDRYQTMDYEVELGIIVAKEGKDIPPEKAEEYIFGYTVGNDFCMRELQTNHIQWFKGKSLDTHSALGPVIVTADEIQYPPDLRITCQVNGEVRQDSRTSQLIFDIDRIFSDFSKGTTLLPGDIILTGTPAGVGMGFEPPKFLKPGDEVVAEIEGIGKLINRIR